MRLVLDTNLHISRLVSPRGFVAGAVEASLASHDCLVSTASLAELRTKLVAEKFARYFSAAEADEYATRLSDVCELIRVSTSLRVCADPADDFLFALAVDGRADCIVSGDRHVLALDPFRGVRVVTPRGLAERLG